MKFINRVTSSIVLFSIATLSASEPAVISIRAENHSDAAIIEKAISHLLENCEGMRNAGADLQGGTAKLEKPIWQQRDFGWVRMVEVQFRIVDSPRFLRPTHESGPISRHTCSYEIGSGEKPGITTAKIACKLVCGWTDDFLSVPKLAGLLGEAPFQRSYDLDALRKAALSGDYQAQRNLAYIMATEVRDKEAYDKVQACAWRKVILFSGNPRSDISDISNEKFACGRLSTSEVTAASMRAKELVRQIKK